MSAVLALDPSLTCTGWSIGDDELGPEIYHAGSITPSRRLQTNQTADRVDSIIDQIANLFAKKMHRYHDRKIVIEMPSYRKMSRHRGGGSGLALYGYCVGSVQQFCCSLATVVKIPSDIWMGGRSKKKLRMNALRYYPRLAKIKDPGLDVSDAVSLLIWWSQIGKKNEARRARRGRS